jgi:uncharacterized circularly permuted ATP-grasp superfamily protein
MGDLFDGYAPPDTFGVTAWDEMFDPAGAPRPAVRTLHDALQALSVEEFEARGAARDRAFQDRGITFQLSGEERPFPLDLVPRIIPEEEWVVLSAGVVQRVKALEAFLADVYGAAEILDDGVVPRRLVTTSSTFTEPPSVWTRPTGSGSTWPGSTWSGAPMVGSTCSRTTCAARRVSPTWWRTAA